MEKNTDKRLGFKSTDAILLKCCASGDLRRFRYMVEKVGCDIDKDISLLGKPVGSDKETLLKRTPLMLAATFGNFNVLNYILQSGKVDVDKPSPSDGATAITCAYSTGSVPEFICGLINARIGRTINNPDMDQNRGEGSSSVQEAKPDAGDPTGEIIAHSDSSSIPEKGSANDKNSSKEVSLRFRPYDPYFMMFTYKVKYCQENNCQNFLVCPYLHAWEKGRRDLTTRYYSNNYCKFSRNDTCRIGDNCSFAHGPWESLYHPFRYRTNYCPHMSSCQKRNTCAFAHSEEEFRDSKSFAVKQKVWRAKHQERREDS